MEIIKMTKLLGTKYTAEEIAVKCKGVELTNGRFIVGYFLHSNTGIIVGSNQSEYRADLQFRALTNPANVFTHKELFNTYTLLSEEDTRAVVMDMEAVDKHTAKQKTIASITPGCAAFMRRFEGIKVATVYDNKTVVALKSGAVGVAVRHVDDAPDEKIGLLEAYIKALTNPLKPTVKPAKGTIRADLGSIDTRELQRAFAELFKIK